jgi:hypothetical protein
MSYARLILVTRIVVMRIGYIYLSSPNPPTKRSHTYAYVTRKKDNVSRSFKPRHVIPDTRISSGQCPRCDVDVTLGARDLQAVREMCARFPRSHEISER